MIQQIKSIISQFPQISDYLINCRKQKQYESYYSLQKLEITRLVETTEYEVTLYQKVIENEQTFVASSSFLIDHPLNDEQLKEKVEETLYAASFVKNENYELVKGTDKIVRTKEEQKDVYQILDQIALCFFKTSNELLRFNSLEIFYTLRNITVVNSQGVDYTKTVNRFLIEAIPSFDSSDQKVELYKQFDYETLDFKQIEIDAKQALNEVLYRQKAQIKPLGEIDVVLKDAEINQLLRELISNYSYINIYYQVSDKKINEPIQKETTGDLLNIKLGPSNEYNFFDGDGVILKEVEVVKDGVLNSYYGQNQFAQYLKLEPTGNVHFLTAPGGKKTEDELLTNNYLEIIALSNIQLDIFCSYIGGEIRLALYHEGDQVTPLTGISFSGNLDEVLRSIEFSANTVRKAYYQLPKLARLAKMNVQ